ncbi:MAG: PcfJ domain-containing protein [Eubacteriales bacterium]
MKIMSKEKNGIPIDGYAESRRIFGTGDIPEVLDGKEPWVPWDVMQRTVMQRTSSYEEVQSTVRNRLPVLLMCKPHGSRRLYRCTACDASFEISGVSRTITSEEMELYQCRHSDHAPCPKCGKIGKVVFAAKWNLKNHWEWRPFVFEYIPEGGKEAWYFHAEAVRTLHYSDLSGFCQHLNFEIVGFDLAARGMAVRYEKWHYDKKYHAKKMWMQSHGKAIGKDKFGNPWAKSIYSDTKYHIVAHPESRGRVGSFLQYMPDKLTTYGDPLTEVTAFAVFPVVEMLYKAGARDLCDQLIYHGNRNTRVIDLCGRDAKSVFRGLPTHAIRIYLSEFATDWGSEMYLYGYRRLRGLYRTDEECFAGIKRYKKELDFGGDYATPICTMRDLKIKPEVLIEYLESKKHEKPGSKNYGTGMYSVYQYWTDYIHAAKEVKLDLGRRDISLPKNLVKRHDEANLLYNQILMERKDRALDEISERYRKQYEFSKGDYTVVIPQSTQAIVQEGKLQGHCVAGYADRHAAGKLAIVFVRKTSAPSLPLITVELHGANLNQARGKKNRETSAEENAFLVDWMCEVGVRMKTQPTIFGNPDLNKELTKRYAARTAEANQQ